MKRDFLYLLKFRRPQRLDGSDRHHTIEWGGARVQDHQHQVSGGVSVLQPHHLRQRRHRAGAGEASDLRPLRPARLPALPLPRVCPWAEVHRVGVGSAEPV